MTNSDCLFLGRYVMRLSCLSWYVDSIIDCLNVLVVVPRTPFSIWTFGSLALLHLSVETECRFQRRRAVKAEPNFSSNSTSWNRNPIYSVEKPLGYVPDYRRFWWIWWLVIVEYQNCGFSMPRFQETRNLTLVAEF